MGIAHQRSRWSSTTSAPEACRRDDEDLALGRALVGAMMELVDRADPTAELRPPSIPLPAPRADLEVTAVFGAVSESQVSRAITAIVAAGLAERAQVRAATPLPEATGLRAGVRVALAPSTNGALSVSGDALVTLFSFDRTTGADTHRRLRVRLRIGDRVGWLSATPDLELRMVTADISVPLDGNGTGEATVTLHDARVFGQSWERLVLGNIAGAVPVLPEARVRYDYEEQLETLLPGNAYPRLAIDAHGGRPPRGRGAGNGTAPRNRSVETRRFRYIT